MAIATKADSLRWKTHWTILGLAFHYAVTAYNHTLSTYINYTPTFSCKDEALQSTKGCVYVNGSTTDSCVSGYEFFSSRGDSSIVTEVRPTHIISYMEFNLQR
uniref:Uncharacterized protein n=1 Tax=Clastoptera arizonana TaxID=38151 RepID=A0A1B6DEI8_9HEMI